MKTNELIATYALIALLTGAIFGALGGWIIGGIAAFCSFAVLMFFGGAYANERRRE